MKAPQRSFIQSDHKKTSVSSVEEIYQQMQSNETSCREQNQKKCEKLRHVMDSIALFFQKCFSSNPQSNLPITK